ncbi:NmrA family NAD(P)-binding protein [Pararhizobium sp. IMCC21322]|uniref:NmrA family NAD(P)-binding protein n=1 Tax=Pararhizobium sp. IMCC21322 TaxID=3067903 RepID=UPI002741B16A|nr:NmrA family NAD(P)-binding protein [Pararhizobium sp. IMCC21322]
MSKPLILVTSASGKTGLQTALQLRQQGLPVRAFIRRHDHRSTLLEQAGAELFVGNQYSLSDMRRAMHGVQRAYQCAPTAPNGLHFNAVFAAAAYEAGVEHVVTLSQWLSSVDHPSLFTREVFISDILMAMRPEMTVTTVNVGWFADNYLMVLDMAAHLGIFAMPLGDGAVKKNAPPSNADVASVAVGALMDPASHAGKTYRPTGPVLLSPNDIAAAMGRVLGREVKYQNISESMMLKALKALPPDNYSEAAVSQLKIYADEYRRGTFAVNAPTQHVLKIGGRVPEDIETIIRREVSERTDLKPGFARTAKAMVGFLKVLATTAPNTSAIEASKDFVQLARSEFCQESEFWQQTHQPESQVEPESQIKPESPARMADSAA